MKCETASPTLIGAGPCAEQEKKQIATIQCYCYTVIDFVLLYRAVCFPSLPPLTILAHASDCEKSTQSHFGEETINNIHLQKSQSYSTLHSTPAFMRYMAVGLRALGGDTQKVRTLLNRKRALEEGIPPPWPRMGRIPFSFNHRLKNRLWSSANSVLKAAKYQVNETFNRCQVFYEL